MTTFTELDFGALMAIRKNGFGWRTMGVGVELEDGQTLPPSRIRRLLKGGVIECSDDALFEGCDGQTIRMTKEMKAMDFDNLEACDGKRCGKKSSCVRFLLGRRIGGVVAAAFPNDCDKFMTIGGDK